MWGGGAWWRELRVGSFFRFAGEARRTSGGTLALTRGGFSRVSRVARCGRHGILTTFVGGHISRASFGSAANCNCGSGNERGLSGLATRVFNTRSNLVETAALAYKARAVTATLCNMLEPNSVVLDMAKIPCSAVRSIVNVSGDDGNRNSLTSFNIGFRCVRLARGSRVSCSTVRGEINHKSVGVICVRHSHKCSLHRSVSVSRVRGVTALARHMDPSAIIVASGYCNRFARGGRPYSIKISLTTNSLVGGPNNTVTPYNNCVMNERSLIRSYTCEVAAPKLNERINTALKAAHDLCVNLFSSPRMANRTLGATMFTTTLFSLLNFGIAPHPSRAERSVVRTVYLRGTSELVTFYRKVRGNTPISSCISPIP